MRAGYIEKAGCAYFRNDADVPQLMSPNDVKIHVTVTGICGSEVHAYHGKHAWRVPPLVSGHEFAGVICEVGEKVQKYHVGQRVTAEPQYGCGTCALCKEGHYNLCRKKKILGATDWSGSFGEYIVVPEQCVIPLGENMSFDEGALIEPVAVGMHAVREHHIGPEHTVAVIGCGTIGLGVILSAACFHPKRIIGIDVVDFNLDKAKQMGADVAINSKSADAKEEINRLTDNQGVDITFVAFGSPSSLEEAAAITKPYGVVSEIAIMPDATAAPMGLLQVKELQFCGSNMYTKDDFREVIERINRGEIDLSGFISKRFPIEQMHDAMEWADKRPEPVVKVVMDF